MLDATDPLMLDYLAHDLDGRRVRLSADALIADAADAGLITEALAEGVPA